MSGKPASVAASRAGVASVAGVAGAPRVLLYVAERQLEHAVAGPDLPPASALFDSIHDIPHQVPISRSVYKQDHNDARNPSAVIYKNFTDDAKCTFDENVTQRTEYFNVSQQYLKESLKEDKSIERENSVKRDCTNSIATEYSVETFQGRVPDVGEIATYQRCPVSSDNMPSMLPVALRHTENQFESAVQVSEGTNCSEREISMNKGYVNYQFLEQSASHQSFVNQSINILNQQVGVSRTIVSEEESCSAPQLVRTAEGVVLAVLPSSAVSHHTEAPEQRIAQSEFPQTVTVPLGWRRIVNGASVLYISPSGSVLSTLPQLREYLQTTGTCKCGLPCPLRPETAFSFDPKVVSKQYQPSSGPELTKLCNHKRKLLATLQARTQSPATPPPPLEQKKGPEATAKKKMKKRGAYISNMNVSQLMGQKDKTLGDFKNQEIDSKRTVSPGTMLQRANPCPPPYPMQQNMINITQESDKHETLVQRSSHYLTVNSGWITQQSDNIDGQKQNHPGLNTVNTSINVGLPVLGTNGQIIGVNTGFNKQTTNLKNVISIPSQSTLEQEHKVDKKEMHGLVHQVRHQNKDDDSQIYCGLNQALTPEVMQKINEQQQIFIQQNQKQIEMAMKGFKTQLTDNENHNKPNTQYIPQGQLVIQNGAVVKTNSAKTPPWQVKRSDPNASMPSPSPKLQKNDNMEYDDQNSNVLDESSNSYNSFQNQDNMNQGMCSRVPPLPQHYNIMHQQWPSAVETNKKKTKGNNKTPKKKFNANENKTIFGNNGLRYIPDMKGKTCDDIPTNNVPSFMDDPSGYLAQQTVLLNNTISKQVGISSSYDGNQYETSSNSYGPQNQNEKHIKQINKTCDGLNIFKNNMVTNSSPSPNNIPDSSLVPEKVAAEMSQCCKGCNNPYKGHCADYNDSNMRPKYYKHNQCTMELDGNLSTSSPKHGFDDNPVSSSTFIERNLIINENSSPIQAGIVSTSNVSPTETLQPPEPSPTLSNSSRSTDTPHSIGSNAQLQNNSTFAITSPVYSGSCRDGSHSNPPTPNSNQTYSYNTPGPPHSHSSLGTQMMHFISNHNVNKNLMEVDNISMVGVKPTLRSSQDLYRLETRKRLENSMPGYCPPPHLGGGPAHSLIQACYVQTFVTTMASGFSVTRDTVTSVLAGKANTATTSINASQANFIRPPPPPSVNLATTYAIPTNQPDPFINAVNLPTSYPLHIAGTTAQNMISKSALEMVQNVISSPLSKSEMNNTQSTTLTQIGRRTCPTTPGQILISSTGQIIVSNNHMPPPPPKTTTAVSPNSNAVTNVTTSITQVVPAVGNVQPIVNQPTVVVNTLPTPFVLQPPMMAVDGQVMQSNAILPQIVTGGIVSGQHSESHRQIELKNGQSYVQGVAMLSPETLKKRNKKKKNHTPNITNVLQIASPQQNQNNIMVHHSSSQQNSSAQFSPRGFQLSPTNNISPTPMLQALTIVPGKSGTPAHIVMNGQGNTNNFGSQQIIANTSPSQPINLLQPVNLINNTTNVMSNFPAFQQFIVPNLGGMVMTADGTAIIQDNSTGMPMQLQLQTVNGQNVLTPVQNTGVFAAGANSGVVIRAQNQQGKIIQSQHSPGAQFLSPNSQVMMNSPSFNGQLSPLLANLSPTNVTFNTSPHHVRTGNVQTQEFIQTNQMGQTLMVPLSPKQVSIASGTNNRNNSTFVQQNTTIVQQQTTLVSNSHSNTQMTCQTNLHGGNSSRVNIDSNLLLAHKQLTNQKGRSFVQISTENNQVEEIKVDKQPTFGQLQSSENNSKLENEGYARFMNEFNPSLGHCTLNVRHSVSTQTLVNQQRGKSPNNQAVSGSSPPDTTTHSPLGALETASSPRVYGARCMSTQGNYADTTTKSPEPADMNSSGMVQCVSSSEQDMAESRERAWPTPRNEIISEMETPNMISNVPIMRPNRTHNSVETSDMHYNQNMGNSTLNHQHVMPMATNYYDRVQSYKRKNEFGDGSTYRTDKIMRTNYGMVHGMSKEAEYENMGITSPEKSHRLFPTSGTSSGPPMQKVFDRHNLGSGDDSKSGDESDVRGDEVPNEKTRKFEVGDLVWGPVKGYASWPGKLESRCGDGKWSVRWFGADKTAGCVEDSRLLTLSEGLEAHHAARTKHRKSRKLNAVLENAIQEAMAELDKTCDKTGERRTEDLERTSITETPKRNKKDKIRNKERHKKASVKSDGAKLRSSR